MLRGRSERLQVPQTVGVMPDHQESRVHEICSLTLQMMWLEQGNKEINTSI